MRLKLILENKKLLYLNININTNKNLHSIKVYGKNSVYELKNSSKDWVKNFKIFYNKKLFSDEKNLSREELTFLNLKKLINSRVSNKEKAFYKLSHFYCNHVNQKIKNQVK